jgi:hypothetical protein
MAKVSREEALKLLDAAVRNGQLNRANVLRQRLGMPDISTEGASFGDRTAVSASRGPGAGLATLQNRYGAENVQQFGQDNFLVPGGGGQPTVFNPPGLDWGDASVAVRPTAEALGAVAGGTMGAVGGLPGVMAGAGVGGELAGQLYDTGMRAFAGSRDTRGPGEILGDTATGVAFNAMGGPAWRPGYVASQAGAPLLNTVGGHPMSGHPYAGNILAQGDLDYRRALEEAGLPPLTPGQRGNGLGQRVEGALESSFGGGGTLDRQRQGVEEGMRSYIDSTFPTRLSREEAGDVAALAVENIVRDKKAVGSQLYTELNALIDSVDGGNISIPESQRLLAAFKDRIARDPEYAGLLNTDPDLARYIDTLDKALADVPPSYRQIPGVTDSLASRQEMTDPGHSPAFPLYDTIKQLRTNVGRKLGDIFATSVDGGVEAEKRQLYGVLSEDLAAGADELGGVAAVRARTRADSYHRGLMSRLEAIDPVFKNADNPTKVYDAIGLMVRSNPQGLAAVKKTMGPEAWDGYASTYFQRLLSARPGAQNAAGDAVSYSTIATNLNKLRTDSPEAWRHLAGDKARALENIATIANRFRESERFFNRSRTANANNVGGILSSSGTGASAGYLIGHTPEAAVAGSTIALTANLVVPWLAAKVLTSPTIQRAVSQMPVSLLGDLTPATLARSLVAAGADESDVEELQAMGEQ